MSKKRKLLIYGTGDLAALACRYFEEDSGYEPVAFVVDAAFKTSDSHHGLPVLDATEIETSHPPDLHDLFIAIGYSNLNTTRAEKFKEAKSRGYKLATYVSSNAIVPSDLDIGENCFVMEGVVIQPFAQLGDNIILWAGCLVSHHVKLEDHCFVGALAVISGRCTVGSFSFIGVNATIRDKVRIAPKSLVGAAAVILQDTEENKSYFGVASKETGIPSDRMTALL